MPTAVGKCFCGASLPPLRPRVRSLSCRRQPTEGHPSHDGQQTMTGGNAFTVNCLTAKHFSTADQGSTGPARSTARSTVKEWMQQLTRKPNFDLQGVVRMLSPLHIDLPKLIPQYKAGWFTVKAVPAVAEPKRTERGDDGVAEAERKDVVKEQRRSAVADEAENRTTKSVSDLHGSQQTEQHDFANAMFNTHESIETFHSEQAKVQENLLSSPPVQKDSTPAQPERSLSVITKDQLTPSSPSFASQAAATATTVTTTIVKQIASYLPSIGTTQKKPDEGKSGSATLREAQKEDPLSPKKTALPAKRVLVAKGSIDRRTRALVIYLREAKTNISQAVRLEELCQHLLQYPDARNVAVKVASYGLL